MIDYNVSKVIRDNIDDKELVISILRSLNENQEKCKDWLIEKCGPYLQVLDDPKICVAAGWYGLLASKLKDFTDNEIVSFDIDPKCKIIGKKLYPNDNIVFKTDDINKFKAKKYDVVICTSCEHFSDEYLQKFLKKVKEGTLVILQSNNYFGLDEHINCKNNLGEFEWSVNLNVLWRGELDMNKYTRYMLCGIK